MDEYRRDNKSNFFNNNASFSRCSGPKGEPLVRARRHAPFLSLSRFILILFVSFFSPFSLSVSLAISLSLFRHYISLSLSSLFFARRCVLVWFASDCTTTTTTMAMQHGVISFFSLSLSLSLFCFFFCFFPTPLAAAFRFFPLFRRTIVSRARKLVDGAQEMPPECPRWNTVSFACSRAIVL